MKAVPVWKSHSPRLTIRSPPHSAMPEVFLGTDGSVGEA